MMQFDIGNRAGMRHSAAAATILSERAGEVFSTAKFKLHFWSLAGVASIKERRRLLSLSVESRWSDVKHSSSLRSKHELFSTSN
jgi:hypothetical protein